MPSLGSYCFKPKHGPEIAEKIIERFVNKFLSYDHEGFYLAEARRLAVNLITQRRSWVHCVTPKPTAWP